MPTVTILFQGVAVHLIGAIPGVPCRVVLPDATASYLYEDQILDRHFTSLQWKAPDGTENKLPFFRQYFTVGNPTSQDFKLDPSMANLYHLDDWVKYLQLSSEVIHAGRTSLYFDIFYGTLACHQMWPGGALYTSLTIETKEGEDPYLIRVPFHYASFDFDPVPPTPVPWPFPNGVDQISVVNMGDGCRGSRYDFALSFLVTRGGIPRGLKDLPGQNEHPPRQDEGAYAPHDPKAIPQRVLDSLSAACSASTFPRPKP
jgi:hypothetical protein